MADIQKEKLEFLKRGEIRTMQKDLQSLKEKEALEEKKRITALNIEEEKQKAEKIEIIPKPKEEKKAEEKERRLPKPLSTFEKILIRAVVVFVILLILIAAFWYFGVKKAGIEIPKIDISEIRMPKIKFPEIKFPWGKPATPVTPVTPSVTPPTQPVTPLVTPPEIIIPPSLISAEETRAIEINNLGEIPNVFSQLLNENFKEKEIIRVLIKNLTSNQVVGLRDFLNGFGIEAPESLYQKVDENFTLFIYSQEEGKRVGFVTKINDNEGLAELLNIWEPKMKNDFEALFSLMDKTGVALIPYFKNATYKNVAFRYQTFSIPHFGICYSIYNDYFIFTSSGKSIMKIIDQLTQE